MSVDVATAETAALGVGPELAELVADPDGDPELLRLANADGVLQAELFALRDAEVDWLGDALALTDADVINVADAAAEEEGADGVTLGLAALLPEDDPERVPTGAVALGELESDEELDADDEREFEEHADALRVAL